MISSSTVGDIVVAASGVVIAVTACYALRAWRDEMRGRARFELARQLVLESYRLEAAFEVARGPGVFPGEWTDRTRDPKEIPEESDVINQWYARNKRIKPLIEHLVKLQELSWEAQAVLRGEAGASVAEAVGNFRKAKGEYLASFEMYFRHQLELAKGSMATWERDLVEKLEGHVYGRKDDEIATLVYQSRGAIEVALTKFLT